MGSCGTSRQDRFRVCLHACNWRGWRTLGRDMGSEKNVWGQENSYGKIQISAFGSSFGLSGQTPASELIQSLSRVQETQSTVKMRVLENVPYEGISKPLSGERRARGRASSFPPPSDFLSHLWRTPGHVRSPYRQRCLESNLSSILQPKNGRLISIHHQRWEVLPFSTIQRQRCIKILCPKDT